MPYQFDPEQMYRMPTHFGPRTVRAADLTGADSSVATIHIARFSASASSAARRSWKDSCRPAFHWMASRWSPSAPAI